MEVHSATALIDMASQIRDAVGSDEGWTVYTAEDGLGAWPYPSPKMVFRGQNKIYPTTLPAITRGLAFNKAQFSDMPVSDQAQMTVRIAQQWWFAREVDHHPLAQYAAERGIYLDRRALAQHYEIPTGHIDMTHSFDVACFFFSCRYGSQGWEPMTDNEGIIYRVEFDLIDDPFKYFLALGPQPLPRPYEQSAWVTKFPHLTVSLLDCLGTRSCSFSHDKAVGEHFLKMFDGGAGLFPPDPLANVAQEIRECKQVPIDIIGAVLDHIAKTDAGSATVDVKAVTNEIRKTRSLINYRRLLFEADIAPFLADFEVRKKRLSETKVTVRPVRAELRKES
jgi:hypothetical protein